MNNCLATYELRDKDIGHEAKTAYLSQLKKNLCKGSLMEAAICSRKQRLHIHVSISREHGNLRGLLLPLSLTLMRSICIPYSLHCLLMLNLSQLHNEMSLFPLYDLCAYHTAEMKDDRLKGCLNNCSLVLLEEQAGKAGL